MPIVDLLLVITLVILGGVLLRVGPLNRQQLDDAFYQLLEEQNSCISLIQLTARARVDVQQVRQYLDRQVQMFGAVPEVDIDGDTFYRFPKLHRRFRADKSA